jgi:hypothetical protein
MIGNFVIHEIKDRQNVRYEEKIRGSLRMAKTLASKNKVFSDTVLKILDSKGRTVSIKKGKNWIDT